MWVELRKSNFSALEELSRYQATIQQPEKNGANAIFIGTMRDYNLQEKVTAMFLEHYPQMTHSFLTQMCDNYMQQYHLNNVLLLHRVGNITPNQDIVLLAVWSSHRREAFIACREMMETLKSKAPFWKKETLSDGSQRWVQENTQG